MGSNNRGYDFDDVSVEVVGYSDIKGEWHTAEESPSLFPLDDDDMPNVDFVVANVVYPDGHIERRTYEGPYDDYEDFEHAIYDWFENGTG